MTKISDSPETPATRGIYIFPYYQKVPIRQLVGGLYPTAALLTLRRGGRSGIHSAPVPSALLLWSDNLRNDIRVSLSARIIHAEHLLRIHIIPINPLAFHVRRYREVGIREPIGIDDESCFPHILLARALRRHKLEESQHRHPVIAVGKVD